MDSQDIRLRAGGFDCEKVQKTIFFAIAFSSIPQITPIQSAIQKLFQRFQIISCKPKNWKLPIAQRSEDRLSAGEKACSMLGNYCHPARVPQPDQRLPAGAMRD
jgi:hypothetical protein